MARRIIGGRKKREPVVALLSEVLIGQNNLNGLTRIIINGRWE